MYVRKTNLRNIGEEKEVWVESGEVVANVGKASKLDAAFAATKLGRKYICHIIR